MKFLIIPILMTTLLSEFCLAYEAGQQFEGLYSLPVEENLIENAKWTLNKVRWQNAKDFIRVSYLLPKDLVGEQAELVQLEGKVYPNAPFFQLTGPKGSAWCAPYKQKGFVCLVSLIGNKMNLSGARSYIEKYYKQVPLKEKKFEIAQVFSNEPIGILILELR